MILSPDQLQAVRSGLPVRLPLPEVGAECVVVRADVFDRVRTVLDDGLAAEEVAHLVEQNMQEYDAGDPLLDGYQSYRA